MNVYIPYTRLPSAYQEVEYIQSSGTQYIKIGTQFKTSYKIVIDFQMTVTGGDYVPIGVRTADGGNKRYGIDAWDSYFKVIAGGGDWNNTIAEDTNRHTITLDKSTAIVDGTSYSVQYADYTFNDGIGVFYYQRIGEIPDYISSNKLYKLDIYDENGTHIYDLVPCYRKSDNVIGLYDLVNSVFYTNQGTGTFSKGNDVTMSELKNAYIGEYKEKFEYSYDFRGKSSSQLSTDGWDVLRGTLETGSSGITSPTGKDVALGYSKDLSTAKKITIDTSIVRNRDDSFSGRGMWFGVALNTSNFCCFRIYNRGGNYQGIRAQITIGGTTDEGTNTGNIGTSSYNPKFIIDLENKTLTGEISGYSNSTYTLSDTQITAIRSMPYLTVYATQHNFYIQNVNITVE